MTKKTRVLWFSRHKPSYKQKKDLKKSLGDVQVVHVHEQIDNGAEVAEILKRNNCQEVVAVLPTEKLQELIEAGVQPIQAVMNRRFSYGKVVFDHSHFERVTELNMTTVPLERSGYNV